jgi:hypothetical protein
MGNQNQSNENQSMSNLVTDNNSAVMMQNGTNTALNTAIQVSTNVGPNENTAMQSSFGPPHTLQMLQMQPEIPPEMAPETNAVEEEEYSKRFHFFFNENI